MHERGGYVNTGVLETERLYITVPVFEMLILSLFPLTSDSAVGSVLVVTMQANTTAHQADGKRINVLLPVSLHREMSKRMVDESKTVTQIVAAAMRLYLTQKQSGTA